MSDLVTRLLALAVKMKDRSRHITYDDVDEGAEALREAADTFVSVFKAWEEERDGLKAKLAEAEKQKEVLLDNIQRQVYLTDEARAEAAALRSEMQHAVRYLKSIAPGMESHEPEVQMLAGFEAALSQPGPGAAYQERMRKLKAVVEAVKRIPFAQRGAKLNNAMARLAALEKKP